MTRVELYGGPEDGRIVEIDDDTATRISLGTYDTGTALHDQPRITYLLDPPGPTRNAERRARWEHLR